MSRCFFCILLMTSLFLSSPILASGFQSRALSLFLKTLNSQINGTLDAASIEFKPPATVVLENAVLKAKSGRELLRVKKAVGTFSLSSLFLGTLKFENIEATEPSGILQIRHGDLELLEAFNRPDNKNSNRAKAVFFKKVQITSAKVTLRFDEDFSCQLNNLNFQASSFDTDFKLVTLTGLKTNFQADTIPLSAYLDGTLSVEMNKEKETKFLFAGHSAGFSLYGFKQKEVSSFNVSVLLSKEKLLIHELRLENQAMRFKGLGEYAFGSDTLNVSLSSYVKDSQDLFPKAGLESRLRETQLETTFKGHFAYPIIETRGHGNWGNGNLVAKVRLDPKTKKIDGDITLDSKAELSLKPILDDDYFLLGATGNAHLGGTLSQLTLEGALRFNKLYSTQLSLLSGSLALSYKDNLLSIHDGLITATSGAISIKSFELQFPSKKVIGEATILGVDLLPALKLAQSDSKTLAEASIKLEGVLPNPVVIVDGHIHDIVLRNQALGDMPFFATYGQSFPHVFDFSGSLSGELGALDIRSSTDIRTKETRSLVEIIHFNANAFTNFFSPWIKFGPSSANGRLEILGTLLNPNAKLSLALDAEFADPEMAPLSGQIVAEVKNRDLKLDACASIDHVYKNTEACLSSDTLFLNGKGSFHDINNWTLNYGGHFNADKAERMSEFLHNELILLDLQSDLSGVISQSPQKDLALSINLLVNTLVADFPDIPVIRLEKPFEFKWSKGQFSISPQAIFALTGGELTIAGNIANERISAELTGRIPLLFSRLFTKNIVEASGLVFGQVALSGATSRPSIDGILIPINGASMRLRALPDDIVFKSGEIKSTVDPSVAGLLHTKVDQLHVNMGNSDISLNGDMNFNLFAESEADILQDANLTLKGNDLSIVYPEIGFEGDIDLRLQTLQGTHWLFGKATVESGKIVQNFSLNNFQFEALSRPGSNFDPPAFFNHFQSNFNVDISSIDLESNLVAFDFAGTATGALSVVGDFRSPRINGIMELSDSELNFPSATFEIPSSIIKFRNSPDKSIDPEIHLKATAELSRQDFGLTDDTTVELSLDGDFDHLNLDLQSIAGDRRLDRLKILLLLINASSAAGNTSSGPGNLSSEAGNASGFLLKPLTAELEKLVSDVTKTRFRIGSTVSGSGLTTSVQWRLNPRIDLEGSASFGTATLGLQDAKFRLLLFDHLPIGRELFLEGIFFAPAIQLEQIDNSQTLRLTYRLLEQ